MYVLYTVVVSTLIIDYIPEFWWVIQVLYSIMHTEVHIAASTSRDVWGGKVSICKKIKGFPDSLNNFLGPHATPYLPALL